MSFYSTDLCCHPCLFSAILLFLATSWYKINALCCCTTRLENKVNSMIFSRSNQRMPELSIVMLVSFNCMIKLKATKLVYVFPAPFDSICETKGCCSVTNAYSFYGQIYIVKL